jgi:hypothetical protein
MAGSSPKRAFYLTHACLLLCKTCCSCAVMQTESMYREIDCYEDLDNTEALVELCYFMLPCLFGEKEFQKLVASSSIHEFVSESDLAYIITETKNKHGVWQQLHKHGGKKANIPPDEPKVKPLYTDKASPKKRGVAEDGSSVSDGTTASKNSGGGKKYSSEGRQHYNKLVDEIAKKKILTKEFSDAFSEAYNSLNTKLFPDKQIQVSASGKKRKSAEELNEKCSTLSHLELIKF